MVPPRDGSGKGLQRSQTGLSVTRGAVQWLFGGIRKLLLQMRSTSRPFLISGHHSICKLAGKTSLRDSHCPYCECDVFLTNDSGPMHIAYCSEDSSGCAFRFDSPVLTGPPPKRYKNSHVVIKPDLSCSPCFERTCGNKDMRCMYAVTF